jgi:hypothetical protein
MNEQDFGLANKKLIIIEKHVVLNIDLHDKLLEIYLKYYNMCLKKGHFLQKKKFVSYVCYSIGEIRQTTNISHRLKSLKHCKCIFKLE